MMHENRISLLTSLFFFPSCAILVERPRTEASCRPETDCDCARDEAPYLDRTPGGHIQGRETNVTLSPLLEIWAH